jgi:hypothetical protein
MKIERLHSDSFDFSTWRNCNIWGKISCRKDYILSNKDLFRKYVIGYIEGERLYCRPKENTVAIMLLIDGEFSWTHLTRYEFEEIFGKI